MNTYGRMLERLQLTPSREIVDLVRAAEEETDEIRKSALVGKATYLVLFDIGRKRGLDYLGGEARKSVNVFYLAEYCVDGKFRDNKFAEANQHLMNALAKKKILRVI